MKLHELKPHPKAKSDRKRLGRGQASGWGKTGARGMNGQKSRSGGGVRLGFEGGQTPMYRRLPKRGFNNERFATEYTIINLEQLATLEEDVITKSLLTEKKWIANEKVNVKVLGQGELQRAITVQADKFSASAKEKIEAAGGKAEVL